MTPSRPYFTISKSQARDVESPDIDEHEVFDASGQRHSLTAAPCKPANLFGISVVDVTKVQAVETSAFDAPRLLHCLREFAFHMTNERQDDLSLAQLLQWLVSEVGYADSAGAIHG